MCSDIQDRRVPPVESAQVAATPAEANLPHEYVVYPGEGHGFRHREHRIDCFTRMLAWFQRYVGCSPRHQDARWAERSAGGRRHNHQPPEE